MGGSDKNEGRVELCWEGFWGQPCYEHWGYFEAQVTCRKLGYNNTDGKNFKNTNINNYTALIFFPVSQLCSHILETKILEMPL